MRWLGPARVVLGKQWMGWIFPFRDSENVEADGVRGIDFDHGLVMHFRVLWG